MRPTASRSETRDRWQLDVHDIAVLAYHDNVTEHDRLAVHALVTTEEHQTAEQDGRASTHRHAGRRGRIGQRGALRHSRATRPPATADGGRSTFPTTRSKHDCSPTSLKAAPWLTPSNSPPTPAATKRHRAHAPPPVAISAPAEPPPQRLATMRFSFGRAEPGERLMLGGEVLLVGGDPRIADEEVAYERSGVLYRPPSPGIFSGGSYGTPDHQAAPRCQIGWGCPARFGLRNGLPSWRSRRRLRARGPAARRGPWAAAGARRRVGYRVLLGARSSGR